jgi:Rnl2 family RNA ligase
MSFPSYEKITESLTACLEDEVAYRALSRIEWVVTEKIHGAGFCFISDGTAIRCAKRRAILAPGEDFFGHARVLDRLGPGVLRIASRVRAEKSAETVYIYGELFGGGYPHPNIAPIAGLQPIQTGVWYSPDIRFCAFDVGYTRLDNTQRHYLDQTTARLVCESEGVMYAEPLLTGAYEEACNYSLGFETTIPGRLGLPSLGPDNQAEGVVIKPMREITVRYDRVLRPVVKRKIPRFSEDGRYHLAEKWTTRQTHQDLEWLRQEAAALANENRLNTAVSKTGRPNNDSKKNQVQSLIEEDIRSELRDKFSTELNRLSGEDKQVLSDFRGEAQALVELYL